MAIKRQGNKSSIRITCGLLASSAELATASNPTYAKKTTVAPVTTDLKPFGINGDQFDTSTSNTPANTMTITMIICIWKQVHQSKVVNNSAYAFYLTNMKTKS
jgi:hypothetical protein